MVLCAYIVIFCVSFLQLKPFKPSICLPPTQNYFNYPIRFCNLLPSPEKKLWRLWVKGYKNCWFVQPNQNLMKIPQDFEPTKVIGSIIFYRLLLFYVSSVTGYNEAVFYILLIILLSLYSDWFILDYSIISALMLWHSI